MKRILILFNIALLVFSHFSSIQLKAQKLTTSDLEGRLKNYIEVTPWEEIYLHTDRDRYVAGEDIWFSIYSLDKGTGNLSSRNVVAYVELISPWNIPVYQSRFRLDNGRGEGSFTLPDSLSSGTYTIRAYTNWMKNFLPFNCYTQNIDICNPFGKTDFRRKVDFFATKPSAVTVKFYPEGGNLLNGTENKVVAKCTNDYGLGVPLTGLIRDNKGDSVASFIADEFGYGTFLINPEDGKNYFLQDHGGLFPLHEAKNDGLSVAVDNSLNNKVEIKVTAVGSYAVPSSETYFIVIQTYGKTDYLDSLRIKDVVTKISVPRASLSGGISQIAMIGQDGRVMFERLIYSPGKDETMINTSLKSIYSRREKVSLNIGIMNSDNNQSGISEMSISVTPAGASEVSQGIGDYMILGSEFGNALLSEGGRIITGLNPDLTDKILICSESIWIKWQTILQGGKVQHSYSNEGDGHYLSGFVKYRENTISDSSKFLYMSIQGKVAEFEYASIDTAGHFNFILPVDSKFRNLILQPDHANNNMILEIEPSFSWLFPESYSFIDSLTDSQLDVFSGLSFNYQVAKIYNTGSKRKVETNNGNVQQKRRFYGIPEMEVHLDDYIKLPNMQEVFFELLPGILLRSLKSGYEMQITNPLTGVFYKEPPLVMIDGVIINDLEVLVDLDPELVEKIEVVKTPYLTGDLILHGIVNVITRSGDFSDIVMPDYAVIFPYSVTENQSVFSPRDYSDEQSRLSRKPDLRNTLYWNPSIKTNRNGEAVIEFWTSDLPGRYNISIQGISGSGDKVSINKSFVVR